MKRDCLSAERRIPFFFSAGPRAHGHRERDDCSSGEEAQLAAVFFSPCPSQMKEAELQTQILQKINKIRISHKTKRPGPILEKAKLHETQPSASSPLLASSLRKCTKPWEMTSTRTDASCVFQTKEHQRSCGAACHAGSWLPSSLFWIQPSRTCLWCDTHLCKCVRYYLVCLFWKTKIRRPHSRGQRDSPED